MSLNMIKLCVGVDSVEHLIALHKDRLAEQKRAGAKPQLSHTTRMFPRRRDAMLAGGSLYWVIKGVISLRQTIVGLEETMREDGKNCCKILLGAKHHLVRPTPRRPFQGWRYLEADDVPPDLAGLGSGAAAGLPPKMRADLAELGLL